ncbi:carbohydrate kinase [Streptosporangiaceae bacterium NEAU-GS5]|nr:carbohydrate kinase [Streptosporangiaceae bacterium NEAU-GS5]
MITVIGEILADLIEDPPGRLVAYPGGSPANVAVGLAGLGLPVQLLTQLGDDPLGRLLLAYLRDNHVRLAIGSHLDGERTSTARTSLSPDGQAQYTFDIAWRHLGRWEADASDGRWETADASDPAVTCVHTGSLATVLEPGADDVAAMIRVARETSMISFDPNCRPTLTRDVTATRDRVEALAAESDIIKASHEDLSWLYPGRPIADVARQWIDGRARLVVITMGGAGAQAFTPRRTMMVPATPVQVVDTVGAGDAFTAGLIAGLDQAGLLGVEHRDALAAIDEAGLRTVLTKAAENAAKACARRGANPPLPAIFET